MNGAALRFRNPAAGLSEVVLTLKAAGVHDLRKFRWLRKPDEISLTHAEELITDLGR